MPLIRRHDKSKASFWSLRQSEANIFNEEVTLRINAHGGEKLWRLEGKSRNILFLLFYQF
jgi:hypothetical protein